MESVTATCPIFQTGQRQDADALVLNYHYSRRIPSNIQMVMTWHEPGGLFGGSGPAIAATYFTIPPTRWSETVWELARLVRQDDAVIPLSSMIGKAIRHIKTTCPIDLLVSFADPTHGHHGGIYQACSWNYGGQRKARMDGLVINGHFESGRACNHRYGTQSASRLRAIKPTWSIEEHWDEGKHLYWKTLRRSGRKKAERLGLKQLPYPKPDTP